MHRLRSQKLCGRIFFSYNSSSGFVNSSKVFVKAEADPTTAVVAGKVRVGAVADFNSSYTSLQSITKKIGDNLKVSSVLLRSPSVADLSLLAPRLDDGEPLLKGERSVKNVNLYNGDVLGRLFSLPEDDLCNEEILHGLRVESANKDMVLNEERLNRFVGGRIALRRAVNALKLPDARAVGSILADSHGAPLLPQGVQGSLSHKHDLALGTAALGAASVGCDIEVVTSPASSQLSSRILTEQEQARLGSLVSADGNPVPVEEEVLLLFSLKESVFKAIHPLVQRQVDWKEVEVTPRIDGSAGVAFHPRSSNLYGGGAGLHREEPSSARESSDFLPGFTLQCQASWMLFSDSSTNYWLSFARVDREGA